MLVASLTLLLGLFVILIIIALGGFFVAQEFAYMSVDRMKLRAAAAEGDEKAKSALKITERTSFMLSGAQLGITVTGLMIGYVAEPLVGNSLGVLLGGVGIDPAISIAVGTFLALAISTIVQMIFGELFPKNYTIATPMKSALALAAPTQVYLTLFGWLIRFFDWTANSLLRLIRIEPVEDVDASATAEDLEHIVEDSRDSGDLTPEQFLILDRVLDFPDQDVEHAMMPRSKADVVQPNLTIGEIRQLMAVKHSRYPVVDDDAPVGVVHLHDVMTTELPDDASVSQLMREPMIVPELMRLPDAISRMREQDQELACVIDEYGGFSGVITLEDIAEEVLGELSDEHDEEEFEEITEIDEGIWRVEGEAHVDEVERIIGHDLPIGDYETISGLLIAHVGGLPEEGETYVVELPVDPAHYAENDEPVAMQLRLTVEEVERHVPSMLIAEIIQVESEDETDTEDDLEEATDEMVESEQTEKTSDEKEGDR